MESDSSKMKIDNGEKKSVPVPSLVMEAWKNLFLNPVALSEVSSLSLLSSAIEQSSSDCEIGYNNSKISIDNIGKKLDDYLYLVNDHYLKLYVPEEVQTDIKKKILELSNISLDKAMKIAENMEINDKLASFITSEFDSTDLIKNKENIFPTIDSEKNRQLLRDQIYQNLQTFKCKIEKNINSDLSKKTIESLGKKILRDVYAKKCDVFKKRNICNTIEGYKEYYTSLWSDHVTSPFLFSFSIAPAKIDKNFKVFDKVFDNDKNWAKQVKNLYTYRWGCSSGNLFKDNKAFLDYALAKIYYNSPVDITSDKRFLAVYGGKKIFIYDMRNGDFSKRKSIDRFLLEFSLKNNENYGVFIDIRFGKNNNVLLLKNEDEDIYTCSLPINLMKKKLNLNQITCLYFLELLMKGYVKKIGHLDRHSSYSLPPYILYREPCIARCVELLKKLQKHSIFKSFPQNEKAIFSEYIDQKIEIHGKKMLHQFLSYSRTLSYNFENSTLTSALINIENFFIDPKKGNYDDVNRIENIKYFCNNCSTNQLCKVILNTDFCSQIVQQIKTKMKCKEYKNSETYTETELIPIINNFHKYCKKNKMLFYKKLSKCITLANKVFAISRIKFIIESFESCLVRTDS